MYKDYDTYRQGQDLWVYTYIGNTLEYTGESRAHGSSWMLDAVLDARRGIG